MLMICWPLFWQMRLDCKHGVGWRGDGGTWEGTRGETTTRVLPFPQQHHLRSLLHRFMYLSMRPWYDTPNKSDKSEILLFKLILPHQDFALCSLATSGCSWREREISRGSRFLLLHFSSSTSSSGSTSTSQLKGGQGRKSDQPTGFLHEIHLENLIAALKTL